MTNNKLNIIVPVYNASKKISFLLQSLLDQTNKEFSLIFCDDGSDDNSFEILSDFKTKIEKAKVSCKIIRKNNGGVSSAINKCLSEIDGGYILQIDADDELITTAVQTIKDAIEKNPNFDMYNFDLKIVNNQKNSEALLKSFEVLCEKDRLMIIKKMLENNFFPFNPGSRVFSFETLKKYYTNGQIIENRLGQNYQILVPFILLGKILYFSEVISIVHEFDNSLSHSYLTVDKILNKYIEEEKLIQSLVHKFSKRDNYCRLIKNSFQIKKLETCIAFNDKNRFIFLFKNADFIIKIRYILKILFKNLFSR